MISSLEAYNNHKRSTLDRLTAKYTGYLIDALEQFLKNNKVKIEESIRNEKSKITFNTAKLKADLCDVFESHWQYTVYVGVSDAMREESGNKNLSWSNFPSNYPIELSFTELAESNKRDKISRLINKRISKKARQIIEEIVDAKIDQYLKRIQIVYKKAAREYLTDEDSVLNKKTVTKIIQEVTGKSKAGAETVFRTETTRYFNQSRVDYFTKYSDTDFMQLIAVTDGRISEICESRDMYVIPIDKANLKKNKPPFHPNCRTIQSPLDTTLKSDAAEVTANLGVEFGTVISKTSNKKFVGKRPAPNIRLPLGWA